MSATVKTTVAVAATLLGLLTATARADWLLWLPECGLRDTSEPALRLHYPRPGLPAVVAAGETLVARVQLRAPLTPPPGRQQPRALQPWGARLSGQARAAFDPQLRLDYPLPVRDVRPDGQSSLVYRVSLHVPSAAAPGSYTLQLRAPGGELRAPRAVVVRAAGDRIRVGDGTTAGARRGPVDLWIATPDAADDGHPFLDPQAGVALLRGPDALWRLGKCPQPPTHARQTLRALAARAALPLEALPPPRARAVPPDGVTLQERNGALLVAGAATATEVDLTLPGHPAGYAVRGGRARFFPGPTQTTLAVRLSLAAHASASVRPQPASTTRGPPPRIATLAAVAVGDRASLRVRSAPAGAWVHWTVDGDDAGYAQGPVRHLLQRAGTHPVHATVVGPDGRTFQLDTTLTARAARRSGCAVTAVGNSDTSWATGAGLLSLLAAWRRRRRRRRPLAAIFPKSRRRE